MTRRLVIREGRLRHFIMNAMLASLYLFCTVLGFFTPGLVRGQHLLNWFCFAVWLAVTLMELKIKLGKKT